MPQNTFLITPDVEKYLFYGHVSGGLEACANASKRVFTPDTKKYLFQGHVSGSMEVCENASKHVFNYSRR